MRKPLIAVVLLGLFTLAAACGGGGGGDAAPLASYPYPVQHFDALPRDHFPVGQVYTGYNSDPPTSGPHAAAPAPWGISDAPVAREMAVHNMEHAGVVVWYNCAAGPTPLSTNDCAQLRNQLASVVQPLLVAGKPVLMTPYSSMQHRIALTGWQYLDAFDTFDKERVQTFLDTFVCRFDPENFCK